MGGGKVRATPAARGRADPPEGKRHPCGDYGSHAGRQGRDQDDPHRLHASCRSCCEWVRHQPRAAQWQYHRAAEHRLRDHWKTVGAAQRDLARVSRVAVLQNPDASSHQFMVREAAGAARALGVQLRVLGARSPNDLDAAFTAITGERADALLVLADPFFRTHRARIADFAAKSRLPLVSGEREQTEVGGLMSYGPSRLDIFRRAATYVDKILKGAKPADLPVEQPTQFELVINLRTAKALGLTIPQTLLTRADEILQ